MKTLRNLSLFVILTLSAGCGGVDGPVAAPTTLQRGISSDPETLDQHKSRSIQAADVIRDLGEGLVGYSATGELVPAAAESWEI
jgi:ABC-type oligopeptide transport system substrate-binding subunit